MSVRGIETEQIQYRRYQHEDLQYTRTVHSGYQQPSFLIQSPVNGGIAAEVIQENFPRLLEIDAKWLANHLFSKKLLSQPILRKIMDSPDNLSLALLQSSEFMKSNGDKFNDFLLILHDELAYKTLVTSLKTEYEQKLEALMKRALPTSENIMQSSDTNHTQDMDSTATFTSQQMSTGIVTPPTNSIPLQDASTMYTGHFNPQGLNISSAPDFTVPTMQYMRPDLSLAHHDYMPALGPHQPHNPAIFFPPALNVSLHAPLNIPYMLDQQTLQHLLPQLTATILSSLSTSSSNPHSLENNGAHISCALGSSNSQLSPSTLSFTNSFLPVATTLSQNQSTCTVVSETRSIVSTPKTISITSQHEQLPMSTNIPIKKLDSKPEALEDPMSPTSKRIKLSTPANDSENNSESSDIPENVHVHSGNRSSLRSKEVLTVENYALTLKTRYKKMNYPTLVQNFFPNEYFHLSIVDTIERSLVNIENIGKLPDGSQAHYILIEGESGVGKTMLLHHIAKQWAAGKIFTQYRMVLLHTVFKSSYIHSFDNLIFIKYSDRLYWYTYVIQEYVEDCNGKDVCFLIDTYDYLQCDIVNAIGIKQHFPEATVLFTCRSEWVDLVRDSIIQYTDQYLKVVGFTHNGKVSYITESLSHCLKIQQTFEEWISQNPFRLALTYRPLYCTMLILLCKAEKLPSRLLNTTDLYKQYIFNEISKHTGKAIDGYCELQEQDIKLFQAMVFAAGNALLPLSPTQSFGLGKYFNAFGMKDLFFTFMHPSFKEFFQAFRYCTSSFELTDIEFCSHNILRFVAGLEKPQLVYKAYGHMSSIRQNIITFPPNACQLLLESFETKSCHLAKHISNLLRIQRIILDVPLEADPLYWYMFGWCLQNCAPLCSITYNVDFHTPLCLGMLLNGCTHHTDSPPSDKAVISDIVFKGGSKLNESLYKLSLLKDYITQTKTFIVSGVLDSKQSGLALDRYLPNLELLSIRCQNSSWIPIVQTLPQLVSLSALHICGPVTDSNEAISKVVCSSIQACKSLKVLYMQNISSLVLDNLVSSESNQLLLSLTYLCITHSTCTSKFANTIRAFLVRPDCSLEKVVFGSCSIHKTVLREILDSLLNSAVLIIGIFGKSGIDDEGARIIADVITNTKKEGKKFFLHDSGISKLGMELVIKAVSKSKNITLCIPSKYKFDFYMYEAVEFIYFHSDFSLIEYIDKIS